MVTLFRSKVRPLLQTDDMNHGSVEVSGNFTALQKIQLLAVWRNIIDPPHPAVMVDYRFSVRHLSLVLH